MLIGVFSGIAAVLLKNLAHTTYVLVIKGFVFEKKDITQFRHSIDWDLLTVLFVRKLIKDDLGHGVSKVLHAISKKNGYIKPHNTFSSVVASSLTVGLVVQWGLKRLLY